MYATNVIRFDPMNPPRIPWHLSPTYGSRALAPAHRPVPVMPQPAPVPTLVVEAHGVHVEASDTGLDRLLRFLGQAIRDIAPYALAGHAVHRVCEAVENSSRK